ncbi:Rpn family recombination-promoting nuclease/putative transposase [Coleofasciculus sp. E2-BRE-01]|uniref:Rpn family recombination-promoting nuclease/putative transposase n=1 Tax=Coleofasciculus sp. E2-BRE-01 TaxID=3069524 RepID=UPI0032F37C83
MRFISPKTDFAFKKIFGSNDSKDILISFLNALIYDANPVIQDLEIIDPYNPRDVVDLKDSYLDVKALLDNGSTVLIEMQVLNVACFEKRVIYNLTKTYANQLKYGEGYSYLKPAIALTITDFLMFNQTQRFLTRFGLKETQELFDYPDPEIELIFVELPKFTKTLDELDSLTDKWIYFIKEAPSLEVIPPTFSQLPELDKAMNIANQANLSVEELEKLRKQEMFLEDQRGFIIQAEQDGLAKGLERGLERGLEQGLEQGLERGRREEGIRWTLRLLERQFGLIAPEIINQIQNLSFEQVEHLGNDVLGFNSLEDLSNWLQENGMNR